MPLPCQMARAYSLQPNSSPSPSQIKSVFAEMQDLVKSKSHKRASKVDIVSRVDLDQTKLFRKNGKPNHKLIHSTFLRLYQQNEFKLAMQLANRMCRLNIIPDNNTFSILAKILVKEDIALVGPVLVNMMHTVVRRKIPVNDHFLDTISWSVRSAKDPLYPRTINFLLEKWCEIFPGRWDPPQERRFSDSIGFAMTNNQLEAACYSYYQARQNGVSIDRLPSDLLTQEMLMKSRDIEIPLKIVQDAESDGISLPDKYFYSFLQVAIDKRDYDVCKFACLRIRNSDSFVIPSGLLKPLIEICAPHGDVQLCTQLLKDFALLGHNRLPTSIAISLIDLLVHNEKFYKDQDDGINKIDLDALTNFLHNLSTIHDIHPNLSIRYMSTFSMKKFAAHFKGENLHNLIDETIKYCDNNKFNASLRTLVMNYILQAISVAQYPSLVFYTFFKFVDKDSTLQDFSPNSDTFSCLLSSAYRIRNAKKLTYVIYKQMIDVYNIQPTRQHFELILKANLVGTELTSILYFLNQMHIANVNLRNNIHYLIYKNFHAVGDSRFEKLFRTNDLGNALSNYAYFPSDSTLRRGDVRGNNPKSYFHKTDLFNCSKFEDGWQYNSKPVPMVDFSTSRLFSR